MSTMKRYDAICAISNRKLDLPVQPEVDVLEHFGEDVFDTGKMANYLTKKTYNKLMATLQGMQPLDAGIADEVANAMKDWAISRGATHYTHWFQPLTGGTAEKHDAFLELKQGQAILRFSGKNLTVGEPDASSLPSGGLRSTFEARGYTAWDPTSPAFIKRHANGATLCIPTVFFSYTGQVLDKKTPLLRSTQALKKAVQRLMACFHQKDGAVTVTLGAEQEYFLIDKKFYLQRPDMIQTGRTLFGAPPAKHQQLNDHYFGSIPPRVLAFMTEVEQELWKLGIPAKTRHNETAPAQFELASIFEELNLAVDHNMLVMEVLRQIADRHGLFCLLHEKPFAGVNGSGKHNNWSISYNGRNLFDPGSNPRENAIFLTMLTAVLRAVDLHSDVLRASTASIGNEYRLGAHEAPPAIISVFLGGQLNEVIEQIERGTVGGTRKTATLRIGVDTLPTLQMDATDRNRTSPFAFTGNKFEFRAPGASQSCAGVNTVLNTIVAESLEYFAEQLEKLSASKFNAGLQKLLRQEIILHKRVIFNGDGYTESWVQEAQKRGLPNLPLVPEAMQAVISPEVQKMFSRFSVLSAEELQSRYEVFLADYQRRMQIEGGVALEIARSIIRPVALREYAKIWDAKGCRGLSEAVKELQQAIDVLDKAISLLEKSLKKETADIRKALEAARIAVDRLENLVGDDVWPLPKYREMLFIY